MNHELCATMSSIRPIFFRAMGAIASVLVACVPIGCSQMEPDDGPLGALAGPQTRGWSQANLPGVSTDAALDAAAAATRQWFMVEDVSPETGTVRSKLQEYDQKGGTGRIRDAAIQYNNRMRRSATVVIEDLGSGCVAKCCVHVQRLDTADHRVFRDQSRYEDYPTETPIDGDAGVSAAKEDVWTDMPRDRQLEREILNALKSRVSATGNSAQG